MLGWIWVYRDCSRKWWISCCSVSGWTPLEHQVQIFIFLRFNFEIIENHINNTNSSHLPPGKIHSLLAFCCIRAVILFFSELSEKLHAPCPFTMSYLKTYYLRTAFLWFQGHSSYQGNWTLIQYTSLIHSPHSYFSSFLSNVL